MKETYVPFNKEDNYESFRAHLLFIRKYYRIKNCNIFVYVNFIYWRLPIIMLIGTCNQQKMYFDNAIVYNIHPQTKIHFCTRVICNVKQYQLSAYSVYFIKRFFYMIHRALDFGKRERIKLSNFPYAFDSRWSPRENTWYCE